MSTDYIPIPMGVARKENAPGSIAALILGIVSLACMAFFGWIPAIIGLTHANKALRAVDEHPGRYSDNSIRMAKTGRTMLVFGIVFGILGMFVTFAYYYFLFAIAFDGYRGGYYY